VDLQTHVGAVWAQLGWVDLAFLGLLLVSVLLGLWRGLVFELMSLVGWLVAYVAAQTWAADVAARLPAISLLPPASGLVGDLGAAGAAMTAAMPSANQHAAGFALVFLAALIAWSLLAKLVRMLVQATPLTVVDRALGAGFGLLRGVVVLLVLVTVLAYTPAAKAQAWQHSHGAAWLTAALQQFKPLLPAELVKHLPD
jgi:membrane protein required for colicin V production